MGESVVQRAVTELPLTYRTVACGTWPILQPEENELPAEFTARCYRLAALVVKTTLTIYVTHRAFQPFDRTDVDDFADVTRMVAAHYRLELEDLRRLVEVKARHADFE